MISIEPRYADLLRAHRRALHEIPELGDDLPETQAYVLRALQACGPDRIDTYGSGVRAVFLKEGAGRTVAFRSDMDALPIAEPEGCAFRSRHDGRMHACGHDGHMANLLTLARWIPEHRDAVRNNVVLIFQPAEETTGGAKRLIEAGVLRDPDVQAIYGMHMMPDVPKGRIAVSAGPVMAETCELNFSILGKASHGAAPHLGRDAIAAAAHLVCAIQTVVSRCVDPREEAVITIGKIRAGTQRNIVADTAELEGICRTFSNEVFERLEQRLIHICGGLSDAFGVRATLARGVFYPCTVNDPGETERVVRLLGDVRLPAVPRMTAEDFSYYQLEVPGVFVFCGCRDERYGSDLHTPEFGFGEEALLPGLALFASLAAEG